MKSTVRLVLTCMLLLFAPLQPGIADDDAETRRMLALNLYHEARSEGRDGMVAIGWVVLNRVADAEYADGIVEVVTEERGSGCEFGWWCDGRPDEPMEPEPWAMAQELSALMLGDGRPPDPTGGAIWLHHTSIARPDWMGDDVVRTATIGQHHFYARR